MVVTCVNHTIQMASEHHEFPPFPVVNLSYYAARTCYNGKNVSLAVERTPWNHRVVLDDKNSELFRFRNVNPLFRLEKHDYDRVSAWFERTYSSQIDEQKAVHNTQYVLSEILGTLMEFEKRLGKIEQHVLNVNEDPGQVEEGAVEGYRTSDETREP